MKTRYMYFISLVLFLSLSGRSDVPAGGWGQAHNAYLICFDNVFQGRSPSIIDLLDALVQNCQYPAADYAEFMTNYSLLAESTLSNLEMGGLSAVVAPYKRRLGPLHRDYLAKIELILDNSLDFNFAYQQLEALYQDAQQHFCTNTKSDIAVLAAIDIAANSTLYWGPRDSTSPSPLKSKWWQVVVADVAGGVVGGLFGGGVGAVGLGSACSGYVAGL